MSDDFDPIAGALAPADAADADWQVLDLRERSRLDPLMGAPLFIGEEPIEPGAWLSAGFADEWSGLPPKCPVVPLGRTKGTCWFLDAMGDIADLKDSSSGKGPIGGLFAGRSRYLEWAWPRRDKKGQVAGWDADDARQTLTDACAFMGAYDPDRMHGRGAWLNDAGRLVYHAGDRVWIDEAWRQPGRHDGWIYPTRPALSPPWPTTVPDMHGPVEALRPVLETWNWRRPEIDVHLLLGWIAMAQLGGAFAWRAMAYVTGEKGCGKSTLFNLIRVLFGGGLLKAADPTGAYLYQKLGHDSIPVVIDELEAAAGGNMAKVLKIIELIRTASSGDKVGRGSSDGVPLEFECRSAFICGSINVPPMRQQDQSRFCILGLQPFETASAKPAIPWDDLKKIGRQLLKRMIDGWGRWDATLLAFKVALIEQGGHDARGAEQFGALLAAAHIAEFDTPPTREQLARWAGLLKSDRLTETAHRTDDWREALNHLCDVAQQSLINKNDKCPTLGHRLLAFRRTPDGRDELEQICRMMGLALSIPKGQQPTWENARLFIPATHPLTRKQFEGTTWEGVQGATGVWHTTLQRAGPDVAWIDTCGRGLDKKRHGIMVNLAKAFPDVDDDGPIMPTPARGEPDGRDVPPLSSEDDYGV